MTYSHSAFVFVQWPDSSGHCRILFLLFHNSKAIVNTYRVPDAILHEKVMKLLSSTVRIPKEQKFYSWWNWFQAHRRLQVCVYANEITSTIDKLIYASTENIPFFSDKPTLALNDRVKCKTCKSWRVCPLEVIRMFKTSFICVYGIVKWLMEKYLSICWSKVLAFV